MFARTRKSARWSDAVKDRILRSRVETTRAVVEALRVLPPGSRPKVMVSASAIGYYGTSNTETFTEKSGPGSDFLARVCREWEAEAARLPEDVRQVVLRIGIVLAKDGGALGKMLPLFAIFAGGPLGSGRQWMSWVHRDDLVALIGAAIADTRYRGAYNATAPQPVRMSEFCSALGAAMGRPSWLPAPEPALKAVLGEGAVVVLEGQKVLPDRAQDTGFVFEYPDIAGAFKDIVK
uniref:DUF1731 domain-containing protein n=1 Tax=Chlamydomonas euryale TaxID=1486919 RepID=A0A7R9V4V5_9CHLO|mmetsp:Transcript_19910/g.59132  ORF Transcript_19910/g.59132 Transcript_19910/m.59132 type:complete len:235 (+) Transcript_19910:88-792(+)